MEEGRTNIYIDGEIFDHCKFLFLDIPVEKINHFDEIGSIDEAAEQLGSSVKHRVIDIPPEAKFWGHCSNLQAWAENNYDTRLLRSNLAFPLLKKLTEVGDPLAKNVFKEEIAKRLESGNENIRNFLFNEGYTKYLSYEELLSSLLDPKEFSIIQDIEQNLKETIGFAEYEEDSGLMVRNRHVVYLSIRIVDNKNLRELPEGVGELPYLEYLDVSHHAIQTVPKFIKNLKRLKVLKLSSNKIATIAGEIGKLVLLESFDLNDNLIKEIPASIGNLRKLKYLELAGNEIFHLPESIGRLSSLESLQLNSNRLKTLPDSIGDLQSLEDLSIGYNRLEKLPETIGNLKNLVNLYLHHNNLSEIPIGIEGLASLKYFHLTKNEIKELSKTLKISDNLRVLDLQYNSIEKLEILPENLDKKNLQIYY